MAIKKIAPLIKGWILDLLFPRYCLGCKKEGTSFCKSCQGRVEIVWPEDGRDEPEIGRLISMGLYRDKLWQNLIQNFKYGYDEELSEAIRYLTKRFLEKYPEVSEYHYDCVVAVPLFPRRQLERSFNQAESFAKIISQNTGCEISSDLKRIKNTLPQAQLDDSERKENVKSAFEVKNIETFKNKKVLLVDDVFTTGATLKEAARAINGAGASEIGAWVMARRS